MNNKTCESCKHFRMHYIKRDDSYYPIHYGHCVYPRLKKREVATPACENYSPPETKKAEN